MNVTYYGHNSFLVEFGGKNLLFDPFISGNGLASDIDVNTIEADYIILCTGYHKFQLPFMKIEKHINLYKHICHPTIPNCGFIGFSTSFNLL